MQALALVLALTLVETPVETQPVETQPVATQPAATGAQTDPASRSKGERLPGDRMVQAGVGVVVAGLAGYGLVAVGLVMGSRADEDLSFLSEREDIPARRDVLARGRLGNRLAIAGGVTASVALAVGIPLIVLGRRRHEAASRARVGLQVGPTGFGLRVEGRF